MRKHASLVVTAAVLAMIFVFANRPVPVQGQAKQEVRFAAVPGERGGQDIFGAYEIVPNWPKPLNERPGHEKWTWGAGEYVFAESPNRVFLLQRDSLSGGSPGGMRRRPALPALSKNRMGPWAMIWMSASRASITDGNISSLSWTPTAT